MCRERIVRAIATLSRISRKLKRHIASAALDSCELAGSLPGWIQSTPAVLVFDANGRLRTSARIATPHGAELAADSSNARSTNCSRVGSPCPSGDHQRLLLRRESFVIERSGPMVTAPFLSRPAVPGRRPPAARRTRRADLAVVRARALVRHVDRGPRDRSARIRRDGVARSRRTPARWSLDAPSPCALMVFTSLHIHQAHGLIEMHFRCVRAARVPAGLSGLGAAGRGGTRLSPYITWPSTSLSAREAPFGYSPRTPVTTWCCVHAAYVVFETALLVWISVKMRDESIAVGCDPRELSRVAHELREGATSR